MASEKEMKLDAQAETAWYDYIDNLGVEAQAHISDTTHRMAFETGYAMGACYALDKANAKIDKLMGR